jgi:hypothetical protein
MESNHAFPVSAISHFSLGTVLGILESSLQHSPPPDWCTPGNPWGVAFSFPAHMLIQHMDSHPSLRDASP